MQRLQLPVNSTYTTSNGLVLAIDNGPFIVGQSYKRPVVQITHKGAIFFLAILHKHKGDFSDEWHYHVDARFISDASYALLGMGADMIFGVDSEKPCMVMSLTCVRDSIPPIAKVLCDQSRDNYWKLEKKCENRTCTKDICPHQGVDLSSVKPNLSADGIMVKTCPCHGLQWDVATGKMVHRKTMAVGSC